MSELARILATVGLVGLNFVFLQTRFNGVISKFRKHRWYAGNTVGTPANVCSIGIAPVDAIIRKRKKIGHLI